MDGEALVKQVRADYLGYAISLGPPGLAGLLLLPVLMQHLSADALGTVALVEALIVPASTLGMMGLKFAYLYEHPRQTPDARAALMTTCMILGTALSLLSGVVLAAMAVALAPIDVDTARWLPLIVLTGTLHGLLITWWRAERLIAVTAVAAYLQLVVTVVATWILVSRLSLGVQGVFAAQCIGQVMALGMVAWRSVGCERTVMARPRWESATALLRYGAPLAGGLMVRYGLDTLARIIVALGVSLEAAAVWLIASRVVSVFDVWVGHPYLMAWGAHVHAVLRSPQAASPISAVACATTVGVSAVIIGLMVGHGPLLQAFRYDAPATMAATVAALLWARALSLLRSPWAAGVLQEADTRWAVHSQMLMMAVFLLAAGPLMHGAGAVGVAWAVCLATGVGDAWLVARGARRLPLMPDLRSVGALAAAAGVTALYCFR